MNNTLLQQVRDLVTELLTRSEGTVDIKDDEPLVISGRLSSLQLVELAAELETRYGIDFADGFNQYDFESINSIVQMIVAKT